MVFYRLGYEKYMPFLKDYDSIVAIMQNWLRLKTVTTSHILHI
jgi:hypothetical protein